MLIICQIDWREVGVAFELQCLRRTLGAPGLCPAQLIGCDTTGNMWYMFKVIRSKLKLQ